MNRWGGRKKRVVDGRKRDENVETQARDELRQWKWCRRRR